MYNNPPPPSPWKETFTAVKANLVPGLALQSLALAVVLAYYFHPPTHAILDGLAEFKVRLGLRYSLVATAIAGGIIPSMVLWLSPRTRKVTPFSHVIFFAFFWAYKGLEVDLMYSLQAYLFGTDATFLVILKKVLVDQILYTGCWSAPTALLIFHWKESGFRFSSFTELNWLKFFKRNLPKALLATWVVWFPAVAIIYSMPSALQIPLFNIVLCFFSLLYISLTRKQSQD